MEGYFGTNCSRECSPYCKHDTCQHTDGSCSSCAAGWMGNNCTTGNFFRQLFLFILTMLIQKCDIIKEIKLCVSKQFKVSQQICFTF